MIRNEACPNIADLRKKEEAAARVKREYANAIRARIAKEKAAKAAADAKAKAAADLKAKWAARKCILSKREAAARPFNGWSCMQTNHRCT